MIKAQTIPHHFVSGQAKLNQLISVED